MGVNLQKVTADDLKLIHKMQVESFTALLEKYQDFDGNPGAETFEKIKKRFESARGYYYFITDDDVKVGVKFRNKGYAQKAMLLTEEIYGSGHWFLDTLKEEPSLCHLYEKMGYKLSGKITKVSNIQTLVEYRKE